MSVPVEKSGYLDPSLPVADRVSDLLGRMTLQEKAAQLTCVWNEKAEKLLDDQGHFCAERANQHFGSGDGLGQVGRPGDMNGGAAPRDFASLTNAIQQFFVENTRLGIPVLFHDETLHGFVARDATGFAQPIGLAATFNPELVERLYEITAREARACGIHQALAPVLDIARDPRWGRVEETYGEDPYLVGELGLAAVKGYQGEREIGSSERVICTLKHFTAHGQPESGNNCAPANMSERHLREICLAPFEKAIRKGGALSVMASYNEIDGVPSHANRWLLRDVLRGEWAFDGVVVSDYYAIRELYDRPGLYGHGVAADEADAAKAAVRAGVNIELPEPDCYLHLVQLVESGELSEEEIDELVAPLLTLKFQLGLFETPFVEPETAEQVVGCDAHRELALEAARQVITLLKNNEGVLPLDRTKLKTVAVIGPNAHRTLMGGYSGKPKRFVTVLEGLQQALGEGVELIYSEGCKITVSEGWEESEVVLSDPEADRETIAAAVEVAQRADAVIFVGGGNEQTSREAWLADHLGDRTDLELVGPQNELIDALHTTGKPLVSVLFNGRPLAINNLAEKSSAVLECWYLGQEAGTAIAEVILGDTNPSGKLPISIPRSVGHIPAFYNYRPSARRGYLLDDTSPLFPFGFGLSYTTFEFSQPTLSASEIALDEETQVSVQVTNTGNRAGCEVVQVYVRDCVSSVTRPVKELKAFQRVHLEPGESRVVSLGIGPEQLAFWNIDKQFVVEPGDFEIMIGPNSNDLQKVVLSVS